MTELEDFKKDVFSILRELSNKIDNLDRKIDAIVAAAASSSDGKNSNLKSASVAQNDTPSSPDYLPSIEFQPWLNQFVTNIEDLDLVFDVSMLDGFKQCLAKNIEKNHGGGLPIWVLGAKTVLIYIYEDSAWKVASEDDIHRIIDTIWRKMLEFYFVICDEPDIRDEEQTRRDICKKNLFDMRKKIVNRHTRDIAKYLVGLIQEDL